MSNRASICQETVKQYRNGQESKVISVFDDYGQGSISVESFSDDDMEVLAMVMKEVQEQGGLDNVETILDSVVSSEKGLYIEGTWYDWKEIKPVFDKLWS